MWLQAPKWVVGGHSGPPSRDPCQPPVRAGLEAAPSAYPAAPHRIVSAAKVLAIRNSVGRYAVSATARALASAQASRARMVKVGMQADPRRSGIGRASSHPGRATAPRVPQPAGSLLYELLAGHLDRQPGELVFLTRLRVPRGMPRSWQAKDLPRNGQVAPSSAAAAVTLPSRSPRARARLASVWSARNRLGRQPSRFLADPGSTLTAKPP
jgi:hypothetical protein